MQMNLDKLQNPQEGPNAKTSQPIKIEDLPEPNVFTPEPNIFETFNTNRTSAMPQTRRGSQSYPNFIEGLNQDIRLRYERLGKQIKAIQDQEKQVKVNC